MIHTLTIKVQVKATHALNDHGATGIVFMHQDIAYLHQILLKALSESWQVEVIDKRPIHLGEITHLAKVQLTIQDCKEQSPMFITKLGHYQIVLGVPWLKFHYVAVRFWASLISFGSLYCMTQCHYIRVTVLGVMQYLPEAVCEEATLFEQTIWPPWQVHGNIARLNGSSLQYAARRGRLTWIKE